MMREKGRGGEKIWRERERLQLERDERERERERENRGAAASPAHAQGLPAPGQARPPAAGEVSAARWRWGGRWPPQGRDREGAAAPSLQQGHGQGLLPWPGQALAAAARPEGRGVSRGGHAGPQWRRRPGVTADHPKEEEKGVDLLLLGVDLVVEENIGEDEIGDGIGEIGGEGRRRRSRGVWWWIKYT